MLLTKKIFNFFYFTKKIKLKKKFFLYVRLFYKTICPELINVNFIRYKKATSAHRWKKHKNFVEFF